jgi:hypothetical protein
MNNPSDFNQVMRLPKPELQHMPPMDGPADAAATWHKAISGNAPELGFADTRKAATSWFAQFDPANRKDAA